MMRRFGCQGRMNQESEHPQTILNANHDNSLPGECRLDRRNLTRPFDIATSMNPNHHGLITIGRQIRRPNVEIKAVLAGLQTLATSHFRPPCGGKLWASRRELFRRADSQPVAGRLWWPPTTVADGGRSVRDAKKSYFAPS